jgi:methylthioribose-1-phosphate isomerase
MPAPQIVEQDPYEIFKDPLPGVTIKNLYFDITPLELVTGFITEEGVVACILQDFSES